MNTRILLRICCLVVAILGMVISVYLVVPSKALADSPLTISPELTHEGLTFDSGLDFTASDQINKVQVVFTSIEAESTDELDETVIEDEPELFVQATQKDEVFAEEIVLPTPKKEKTKVTPTPTKKITPTITEKAVLAATTAAPTETAATPTPEPTKAPETTPSSSLPSYATNGSLNADTLFSMVNQKRSEAGLPAFEKHPEVCSVAESRRGQIENEVYGNSSIHAGFRAMDLPFRASENMISQGSEEAALNWWMNSPIHRAGILGGSKYACLICQNKTCAMIMSSLDPK